MVGKKQSWRNLKYCHVIFPEEINKNSTNRSQAKLCLSYDSECWIEAAHPEGRGLWCASLIYTGSRVLFVFFQRGPVYRPCGRCNFVWYRLWTHAAGWLTDWQITPPPSPQINYEAFKHFHVLLWQMTIWRTIPLFYNTFITVLYMFRAMLCSSSGGKLY